MAESKEPAAPRLKNRLVVDVAKDKSSDSSVIELNPETMEVLDIFENDFVEIKGRMKHSVICMAVDNENVPPGVIAMNRVNRKNLKVGATSMVSIAKHKNGGDVQYAIDQVNAAHIKVSAIEETVAGVTGDFVEVFLRPYFSSFPGRPLKKGQLFSCAGAMKTAWFKVISVTAADGSKEWGCVMTEGETVTAVEVTAKPLSREEGEAELNVVGYDDIGGLGEQLQTIREMVELPLRHPKLFSTIGVRPPKGVLMHGPPGTGKTLIARAIAHETGCFFFTINGPEIMSGQRGGSEKNLRDLFAKAEEQAPAIVFIDEIDAIAPNRDKVQDEHLRRVVATLLTLMDGLKKSVQLMVIAATNRPNSLDPALRRAGRFDTEVVIGVPSQAGRREILDIMTRKQKLADDVDLDKLASMTHGYVGADLSAMCMKAAVRCIRQKAATVDLEAEELDAAFLDSLAVSMEDFCAAVGKVPPSALKDVCVEIPNVSFDDIGGLEGVKREVREMVEFPVKYPELFEQQGIQPPKGALFYGPPGCGKTLMAKAMANECGANFISIKGPQLLTKWWGESEENVRGIFDKARQASPCILFFDELDALVPTRGGNGDTTGVSDRVVNQMLTEMDGVGERKNVFLVGATNRVEIIDPAIRRPGRLDQLIYIPMPDYDARVAILRAQLRHSPVSPAVDLPKLAAHLERYSGADIAGMCQMAVKLSVRARIAAEAAGQDTSQGWALTDDCFEIAMLNTRRSVSDRQLAYYRQTAATIKAESGGAGLDAATAEGVLDQFSGVSGRYQLSEAEVQQVRARKAAEAEAAAAAAAAEETAAAATKSDE